MNRTAMNRNVDVAVARAFLAVVETGSVTLAAQQLNLTQGAISQQLRRLEELADHPLFLRAGRRIAPTAEGKRLAPNVKQFLAANEQLIAALRQPAFEGEVRFGVPYDIIGSYAPQILRRFSQAFPGIRISLIARTRSYCAATSRLAPSTSPSRRSLVAAMKVKRCAATDLFGREPAPATLTHATRCRYRSGRRPVYSDRWRSRR
jgi:DNA-binding transcriptional LysR family regulator